MNQALELFDYRFVDNQVEQTLFLLHGTGGSKDDFLFLDKLLKQKYNLVGLQGRINENGLTRFFKRHSLSVFDQESIKNESKNLKNFIAAWTQQYKIKLDQLTFLGYSNGANLLLATLFYYPEFSQRLILLHPMLPFEIEKNSLDLSRQKIFISLGQKDQIIPRAENAKLIDLLKANKAKLIKKEYPSGHEITKQEINDLVLSLNKNKS